MDSWILSLVLCLLQCSCIGHILNTCYCLIMQFRPWSKIPERNWEILDQIRKAFFILHPIARQFDVIIIFLLYRSMEMLYPTPPSISEPLYILCTRPDLQKDFPLLFRFLLEYSRLKIAGSLLPKLISFYQWLHRELAHRLTKETAKKLQLNTFRKRVQSQFPKDKARQYESLYSEIGGLSQYIF